MGFYLNKVNTTPLIATSMMMMMMRLLAFCFLFSIGSHTQALASGPDTCNCQYEDEERHLTCEVQADSSRIPYLEAYSRATTLTVIGIFDEVDIAVQYAETITRLVLEPEWLENEVCSSDSFTLADYALFSSSLRALEVAGCYGAVSFEGAPAFVALEEMDFGEYAEVATDGYASFPVLRRLQFRGRFDFDLSVIPASLQKLDLSNNEITKIDFNKLGVGSQLEIDLSLNGLDTFNLTTLEQCSRVKVLYLDHNLIDESTLIGSFKNFTNLQTLSLRNNEFNEFDFSVLPESLQVLDLSENNVVDIDFNKLGDGSGLEIDLRLNEFTELDLKALEPCGRLKSLNLGENSLGKSWLNGSFRNFINLEKLSMRECKIKEFDLSVLPESLQFLDLNHNEISEIDFNRLGDGSRLKIDLSENLFVKLELTKLEQCSRVKALNLGTNKIKESSINGSFKNFIKLETLSLETNDFTEFDYSVLPDSLQNLDHGDNSLKGRLSFRSSSLSFESKLKFERLNLETLSLKANEIEEVDFSSLLESLRVCDLSRNRIENVDFSQMQHLVRLQTLNLAQNKLETFSFDGIGKLSSLENLLLRGNRISAFDADATDLASLKNLKTLDLSKNHLKRFNFAILPTSFSKLNLDYNSLGKLDLEPLVTRDWSQVVLGNRNLQGSLNCSCKVLSDTYRIVSASGAAKRELRFHCDEGSDVRFEPATVSSYVHNREFPYECDEYDFTSSGVGSHSSSLFLNFFFGILFCLLR